jgi:hypothetical protein
MIHLMMMMWEEIGDVVAEGDSLAANGVGAGDARVPGALHTVNRHKKE